MPNALQFMNSFVRFTQFKSPVIQISWISKTMRKISLFYKFIREVLPHLASC